MRPIKDITGQVFGRLTAVSYAGGGKWLCRCECGRHATVITSNLLKGNSTSCGCRRLESQRKHGMAGTPQWHAWQEMRQRCGNPASAAYRNYGGRGIKVCDRWASFALFVEDMGLRPAGYQLDRIDNDGDYEPGNCRWVPARVNLNNRRNNHRLTWQGETLNVSEWADRLGVNPTTLFTRMSRGWSVDRVMTEPVIKRRQSRKD